MEKVKSYTDLKQSYELSEILPLESADQTYERIVIAGDDIDVPEEMQYRHNGNMPFQLYSGSGVPCWSLAALLNVLPRYIGFEGHIIYLDIYLTKNLGWVIEYSNDKEDFVKFTFNSEHLIDACVDMIIKLHEKKLL